MLYHVTIKEENIYEIHDIEANSEYEAEEKALHSYDYVNNVASSCDISEINVNEEEN